MTLVIGDGQEDLLLLEEVVDAAGCHLIRVEGFEDAVASCTRVAPDLVFMPLTVNGRLAKEQLNGCLARHPKPIVIVIASNDQINTAAEAMRLGAFECLFKPFSRSRLARTIEEAMTQLGTAKAVPRPARRTSRPAGTPTKSAAPASRPVPEPRGTGTRAGRDRLTLTRRGFVASSAPMQAVLEKVSAVANSDVPVFISGEVGTGKTALAEIVHEMSPNAAFPIVTLRCAALTRDGFDSLMSGADGALARAARGTLYLDEVAELPAEIQPTLLQLIERIETGAAKRGIRIVASTSHDPQTAVRTGILRPDLFYRLHVAPIELPPLRQRGGDPELIARIRLAEFSEHEKRGFVGFSDTALAMISGYDWPGNLHELANVIKTLVLMNKGPLVTPDQLPTEVRAGLSRAALAAQPPVADPAGEPTEEVSSNGLIGLTLAEIERAVVEATIRAEGGSVPRAAQVLDVSPSTLYRKRQTWAKRKV